MTLLRARQLTKRFGGHAAVDRLDLSIEAGEIRCLIGPNGAGKSTALALLAGSLSPSAGAIYFDGSEISNVAAHDRAKRGISIKFQLPSVFPELSVRQNLKIALSRRYLGSELDDRIDETLDLVELSDQRGKLARVLSHGQKQWLEFGLAISLKPRLLLLDEPTAGMTPEETERTGELVLRLNRSGVTVVAVEHDMQFVRQIARTVSVLHLGTVFSEGRLNDVLANEDVKKIYFGEAPRHG
ncbi:MAG: ABC transporter ATP-binding protein [Xanthobacteraceae bacterium]|nr:ABC transporter ATP-binding protein [Xanthobacteraceae bacterium]